MKAMHGLQKASFQLALLSLLALSTGCGFGYIGHYDHAWAFHYDSSAESGEVAVKRIYSSLSLGSAFSTWCEDNRISPSFALPVQYPENPVELLKKHAARFHSTDSLTWFRWYSRGVWSGPTEIPPAKWRHLIFEWRSESGVRPVSGGIVWTYLPDTYDTLPLDGSYAVHFILISRSRPRWDEPFDGYIGVLVSPDGIITGWCDRSLSISEGDEAKALRRAGVYF